jgi:hypothetical protein
MKGLDRIQGLIYAGTGCVFRSHALYGYDAPTAIKAPSKACNCWPIHFSCHIFMETDSLFSKEGTDKENCIFRTPREI